MWKVFPGAVVAAALMIPGPGLAGVKVRFVGAERYTDAGSFGAGSSDFALAEFRRYFEKLGQRFLAPGADLTIDVLDIDLAGQYEPRGPRLSDVRILRDTTPPRFRLRYVLSERGRRKQGGDADITDVNYQMDPSARLSTDRYAYEKVMLADWFRKRFGERQQ